MKKRFSLLDLFYPRRCVFCGRFLDKNVSEELCSDCAESLPYTLGGWKTAGEFFDYCASPLYYEGRAAEAVRKLKFSGKSARAVQLGRMLGRCARERCGEFEWVSFVPLSARRERRRGYCQARLLAEAAAKELGKPCVSLLKKHRDTPPQTGLKGAAARKANVSGAYTVPEPEKVSGRSVLLVDDVITTGATLSECTRMLLMAGANRVVCATVCKTRKKKPGPAARNKKASNLPGAGPVSGI